MIIHLLLTFCAYSQACNDVNLNRYYGVVGELVVLTMSCSLYERADGQLAEWLSGVAYSALSAVHLYFMLLSPSQ